MIVPLLSRYATDYHATPFQAGLLVASYSLAQFVFAPVWGHISDRVGRKPILTLTLAGNAIAYTVYALSRDLTMLFVSRSISGVFAANISTAQAYVADVTTPQNRAKGMGMIGMAFGLGFVLGPAMGGPLGKYVGIWAPGAAAARALDDRVRALHPPARGVAHTGAAREGPEAGGASDPRARHRAPTQGDRRPPRLLLLPGLRLRQPRDDRAAVPDGPVRFRSGRRRATSSPTSASASRSHRASSSAGWSGVRRGEGPPRRAVAHRDRPPTLLAGAQRLGLPAVRAGRRDRHGALEPVRRDPDLAPHARPTCRAGRSASRSRSARSPARCRRASPDGSTATSRRPRSSRRIYSATAAPRLSVVPLIFGGIVIAVGILLARACLRLVIPSESVAAREAVAPPVEDSV